VVCYKPAQALFNHSTQQMKDKWDVVKSKPLADFMPTILLKAKDFATEITMSGFTTLFPTFKNHTPKQIRLQIIPIF
jgi:DNA-damage-inducible protein D